MVIFYIHIFWPYSMACGHQFPIQGLGLHSRHWPEKSPNGHVLTNPSASIISSGKNELVLPLRWKNFNGIVKHYHALGFSFIFDSWLSIQKIVADESYVKSLLLVNVHLTVPVLRSGHGLYYLYPTRIRCRVHLIWCCMRSKNTQFMRGGSHPILICCSMINYSGPWGLWNMQGVIL